MWGDPFEPEDDWEPLRTRRAGTIRMLAVLVVAAMVIALVLPVILRLLRGGGDEPPPPEEGVRALVAIELGADSTGAGTL